METFPKASVPSSHKGERLAFTCLRRCEGSTPRACWGQKVPSGLSTTLHGAGDTHTYTYTQCWQVNLSQPEDPTGKWQLADLRGNRPTGPMREGGRERALGQHYGGPQPAPPLTSCCPVFCWCISQRGLSSMPSSELGGRFPFKHKP